MAKSEPNSPPTGPAILIENLWMRYPGYWLVIPKLEIPPGFVGLLGESGSGKSTLLNFLALLDEPRGGEIEWNGESRCDIANIDAWRRERFSFLFQSSNLISNFKNKQNVAISRDISGESIRDATDDSIKQVTKTLFTTQQLDGKNRLLDRFPSGLSGGQKQRIAVARAIVKAKDGADFLFADEPTANIDKKTAEQCVQQLVDWSKHPLGNLLLTATHDLSIARNHTDHLILIGLAQDKLRAHVLEAFTNLPGFKPPTDDDRVFTVLMSGPRADIYERLENTLLKKPMQPIDQPIMLTAPPQQLPATVISPPPQSNSPTGRIQRRTAHARFLLSYCWRDIRRTRELFYNASRMFAVIAMFVWLAISASIMFGVPRLADNIFRQDPLLRLVEISSLASFVISPDTMHSLEQLQLDTESEQLEIGRQVPLLIAGVIPRRDFSCRFYDTSGLVRTKWTNGGRWVFDITTMGDPLFDFWNLAAPNDTRGVIVRADLLKELGYDETAAAVGPRDSADPFVLYIDVFDKVALRVDHVVESFPDPHIDFLIPAELANHIRTQQAARVDEAVRSISFYGYPNRASTIKDLDLLKVLLRDGVDGIEGDFRIKAERRPVLVLKGSEPIYQITVRPPASERSGIAMKAWERVTDLYNSIPRPNQTGAYPVAFGGLKPPESVLAMAPPPRTSMLATMYVHDYKDIPRIIDRIDSLRSEFKIEVTNKKSKETIRTVERSISLGTIILWVITIAVTALCVLCLMFSFIPQIQRKSGEIGIIRAYGASKLFVFLRFMIELTLTCAVGFAISLATYAFVVIPILNGFARAQAPDLFGINTGPPLRVEWLWTAVFSFSVFILAAIAVGVVIYNKVGKKPADLLRMAD